MKYAYIQAFLSVFALLLSSCIPTGTHRQQPDKPATTVSPDTAWNEDPSFTATSDTISAQGPRSITRSILRDKSGKLWFASWQGAWYYDDTYFTNITLKEGMKHFHIFSLLEDSGGQLWLGSIKGGVFRYDPVAHSSTQFITADGLSGNTVLAISEDKAGNIWLGTTTGLTRYHPRDPGASAFTRYTTLEGLNNNAVNAILQDRSGKLWFGTNGGLCYYDPEPSLWAGAKSFKNFPDKNGKPFNNVRSLIEDRKGNIWIACEDGLWQYHAGTQSFTRIRSHFTGCVFEDKVGHIWFSEGETNGAYMDLFRYDGKTFTLFGKSAQVFGIAEDRHGNIWFGSEKGATQIKHAIASGVR